MSTRKILRQIAEYPVHGVANCTRVLLCEERGSFLVMAVNGDNGTLHAPWLRSDRVKAYVHASTLADILNAKFHTIDVRKVKFDALDRDMDSILRYVQKVQTQ